YRKTVVRSNIGAAETVAGYQHHSADAGRSRSPARFAYTLDAKSRFLGGSRLCFEVGHGRQVGIDQIEVGKIVGQQATVCRTDELALRNGAAHGNGSFGQGRGVAVRPVIG